MKGTRVLGRSLVLEQGRRHGSKGWSLSDSVVGVSRHRSSVTDPTMATL